MATDFYKQNGSYYTTSGQKILNPTDLQTYAQGGGKEVSAPTIPSNSLSPANSTIKDIAANKQIGIDRLKNFFNAPTFDPTVMDKSANSSFLNAVSLASQGKVNQDILNLDQNTTVRNVLNKYNLGQYAPNMNIKGDNPAPVDNTQKTNPTITAYDNLIKNKMNTLGTPQDLSRLQEASQSAAKDVEMARQSIADKQLLDAQTLKNMEGKVIPLQAIAGQQSKYTEDQQLENMKATQDYNNKVILSQMAQGNFTAAQQLNQSIANDVYQIQQLEINRAKEQNAIDEAQKARLDAENTYQRNLAIQGYVYISDPSKLKGLTEDKIYRDPATGKIYKKPELTGETQIVDADGMQKLIDSKTGKVITILGTSPKKESNTSGQEVTANSRAAMVQSFMSQGNSFEEATRMVDNIVNVSGGGGTGMRTDRNNNPTAMTTDVAQSLGLVEGVDYVKGDAFPNNPNLFTAKFIGDPIATTTKALDIAAKDPNKSAFFTQSGQPRWSYTSMTDDQWLKLSPGAKKDQIALMYKNEGGNGSLIQSNIDKYSDQVKVFAAKVASGEMLIDDSSIKPVEAKLREYMTEYGIKIPLSAAQIKQIESSAPGKALTAAATLIGNMEEYKTLIEQYGSEAFGSIAGRMKSLWADIGTGWKEMKNLGAITGPDMELMLKAVPDMTGVNGMFTLNSTAKSQLEKSIQVAKANSLKSLNSISSKNPNYKDSDYFNNLQTNAGFGDDTLIEQKNKLKDKNDILVYDTNTGKILGASPTEKLSSNYIKINF